MRVRGTQKLVKPVEVNVDTVYIRTNIRRIEEDNFEGWEYNEDTYNIEDYIEQLTNASDVDSIALLVSMLMSEVDFLRMRIEVLERSSA